jgi:PIN domain nuclease of toxin-antitoxin system
MSPADAMCVASRERTTQYARKYIVLHKISEWEVHLNTAKGKVHECEEMLQKLREEVEVVDSNLGRLENGMEDLKRAMQQPQHPHNFVAGSGVRDSESVSSLSSVAIVSPLHEP